MSGLSVRVAVQTAPRNWNDVVNVEIVSRNGQPANTADALSSFINNTAINLFHEGS